MGIKFRDDFIFGVAASSYQIEGAVEEDGRTPSIWDEFSRTPGKVRGGDTGDTACDHYHRYIQDISLMQKIGIEAYSFSISWPRIFPKKGKYNSKGMQFYIDLVKELVSRNIRPVATLFHWDLPLWAHRLGGWLNRDSVKWFTEYALIIFETLSEDVKTWITHCEPMCSSLLGYYRGSHAPGHTDIREALTAAHHILLSHGRTVKAFRNLDIEDSKIGITLNVIPVYPATGSADDRFAARIADGHLNRWFLDPIFRASYPEDMLGMYRSRIDDLSFIKRGDLEDISATNDFLGINYYTRELIKYSHDFDFERARGDNPRTEMDWEIVPGALYRLVHRLRDDYTGIPFYITENGAAFADRKSRDGRVHDEMRINYLRDHLLEVAKLCREGVDIRGYFLWSIMDNFEWEHGYSKRFGIMYVDYKTQERILKDSAYWYSDLIRSRVLR